MGLCHEERDYAMGFSRHDPHQSLPNPLSQKPILPIVRPDESPRSTAWRNYVDGYDAIDWGLRKSAELR
jgi:hypothetical protein